MVQGTQYQQTPTELTSNQYESNSIAGNWSLNFLRLEPYSTIIPWGMTDKYKFWNNIQFCLKNKQIVLMRFLGGN